MGRAICQCGQQVRTNSKSGSEVQCPRCETWLTVAQKVLDPNRTMEEKRIDSDPEIHLGRTHVKPPPDTFVKSNTPYDQITFGRTLLASCLAIISIGGLLWAYFGSQASSKNLTRVEKPEALKTSDSSSMVWGQLEWKNNFEAYPKGAQVKQIATKITDTGKLLDPGRFWEQLDASAFEKKVRSPGGSLLVRNEKIPIKQVVDGLKAIPFDSISKPDEIVSCQWDTLGVNRVADSLGVLVRYFQEPINISELITSDDWISSLSKFISVDEYINVAKDLYSRRKNAGTKLLGAEKEQGKQEEFIESIFTPYFGYIVLTFNISEDAVLWSDVTCIPGEVRLSRACGTILQKDWHAFQERTSVQENQVPSGWKSEGVIDVFGEYESPEDQFFARELVFCETKPDGETVARIDRAIPSVSSSRSKELISIALSVTSNYGQLRDNVSVFRKSHPKDLGLDALLLSLWMKHHDSKRSGLTYDDFGVIFVDAADRLYTRFKDPTLIDIKARIYWSHSRYEETDEQLSLAEALGTTTAFFFKRRIEQAIQKEDKSETLNYLSKFNTFWLSQPGVELMLDSKPTLNKLGRRWKK